MCQRILLSRQAPHHSWLAAHIALNATTLLLCIISLLAVGCGQPTSNQVPSILLFNGTGVSVNDVAAIETILRDRGLDYATADSEQLNGMSESQLGAYRLLDCAGRELHRDGRQFDVRGDPKIRQAVEGGLNYLGICAGGFLAADGEYKCFNLTSGVRFGFYSAEEQGIRKAAVAIAGVDTPALEHYWEDGPQFTGWGTVVGKYPDGTPAIAQGDVGKGWVICSAARIPRRRRIGGKE